MDELFPDYQATETLRRDYGVVLRQGEALVEAEVFGSASIYGKPHGYYVTEYRGTRQKHIIGEHQHGPPKSNP